MSDRFNDICEVSIESICDFYRIVKILIIYIEELSCFFFIFWIEVI